MTRASLKMARAQAATTALRAALDAVRRLPPKEAETRILKMIADKRPILDDWRHRQDQKRNAAADAEYYEANAALLEDEGT